MKNITSQFQQLWKEGRDKELYLGLQSLEGKILMEVLCSLAKIMQYDILPILIQFLKHERSEVQESAKKAIEVITNSSEYEFLKADSKMKNTMQGCCHAKTMGARLARLAGIAYFNYSEEEIDYLI